MNNILITEKNWPPEWTSMSEAERRDDLLRRMFSMPPKHHPMVQETAREDRLKRIATRVAKRKISKEKPNGFQIPVGSLLDRINQAIPRMRPEWREELCQELALAIAEGEIEEAELENRAVVNLYFKRVKNMFSLNYSGTISLGERKNRDATLTVGETLVGDEDVDLSGID